MDVLPPRCSPHNLVNVNRIDSSTILVIRLVNVWNWVLSCSSSASMQSKEFALEWLSFILLATYFCRNKMLWRILVTIQHWPPLTFNGHKTVGHFSQYLLLASGSSAQAKAQCFSLVLCAIHLSWIYFGLTVLPSVRAATKHKDPPWWPLPHPPTHRWRHTRPIPRPIVLLS